MRNAGITGPGGQQWSYTYDLRGDQLSAVDPDAGSSAAAYYPDGDLKTSTDGNGQQLTYSYDLLGRKTAEYAGAVAPSSQLAAWTYDTVAGGKGQPATSTAYVGGTAGVGYTQAVTGYTNQYAPTGTTLTIPANAPAAQQALVGTYTTTTGYTAISGQVAQTAYGPDGGLPAETVRYGYTGNGILGNVGGLADYLTGSQIDPYGRHTRWELGDMPYQVAQTNIYDQATGRTTEQTLDKETGASHVDDITTVYNLAGQVTATKNIQDGSTTDLQCYTYNQLGQLTAAWTDTAGVTLAPSPSVAGIGGCTTGTPTPATIGGPAPYWQTYHDNTSGNRDTETDHDPTGHAAADITRSYTYNAVGAQPDQLRTETHTGPGAGTDTYSYDPAGQATTRSIAGSPSQTLTYTPTHHTASVTDTAGNSAGYTYDASGNLLLQTDTVNGVPTVTLYLGAEQLTSTNHAAASGIRYYTTGGGPTIIRTSTGALTYQCGNNQNTNTVAITADTAQNETRRYYLPYGNPRGTTPTTWPDNRTFLNQPTDPATGLDLLGARQYDPHTGRFLQPDPILETTDPNQLGGYTYAANNPIAGSDPTGTISQCISIDGSGVCGSQLKTATGQKKLDNYEGRQQKVRANETIRSTSHCATLGCYNACKYGGCGTDTSRAKPGSFAPPPPPKPRGRSWLGTALGGLKGAAQNISHAAASQFHNDIHSLTSSYHSSFNWVSHHTSDIATAVAVIGAGVCIVVSLGICAAVTVGVLVASAGNNYYHANHNQWALGPNFQKSEFWHAEAVDGIATVASFGMDPELVSGLAKLGRSTATGELIESTFKGAGANIMRAHSLVVGGGIPLGLWANEEG